MEASMRGPWAKIERAKKHIDELEAAIGNLLFTHSKHPNVILTEEEPDGSQRRYKVGYIPEIPDPIAAMAGDVVHNLRSALDLLFGQLVLVNGKSLGKDYFPISVTREEFEARCKAEIKGRVGEDAFNLICATEAYGGGKGDALWRVNALDIEDKHRLLFVIGLGFHGVTPTIPTEGFTPEPAVPKTEPKFALFVAFSESQIVQGEPVLPTLLGLAQEIEGTVEAFAPLVA